MGQASTPSNFPRLSPLKLAATAILFVSMAVAASLAQAPASVEARTAAINRILADYRDDQSRREPEAASLAGDKRFDDQLTDFSASAANARLSRGQTYIQRLSEIDTAGLPEPTRQAAEKLLNSLIEEQAGDQAKTWLHPLDQFTHLHIELIALAEKLPFTSIKDYDDYIARLKKLPAASSQIMTNIQLASDAGRLPPKATVDAVLAQIQTIASQPAETSPFAAPLKRFPASIAADDRKRIAADLLDTISNDVIPSYVRVGRFIAAHAGVAPAP